MLELAKAMREMTCIHPEAEQMIWKLSKQLSTVAGKKTYGYLPKPMKKLMDEIVDQMARLPMAKRSFASYATRSSAGRLIRSLQRGSMRGYQIGASRTTPLTARGILFYSPTPVIFLASGVSIPRWSCTE